MNKKGQAALEFLMTYGWAILAAVIVIGVLWFLIGNPANLVGNKFLITDPFVANAHSLSTGSVQIEVRNGAGESVTVTGLELEGCGSAVQSQAISAGSLQAFTVTCSPALTTGDRFTGDLTLNYTTSGSSVTQRATGSVSGRVP